MDDFGRMRVNNHGVPLLRLAVGGPDDAIGEGGRSRGGGGRRGRQWRRRRGRFLDGVRALVDLQRRRAERVRVIAHRLSLWMKGCRSHGLVNLGKRDD